MRELVAGHPEVDLTAEHAGRRPLQEDGREVGVGLAEHQRRVELHDPGLLGSDVGPCRTEILDVIHAHVGDHGHHPIDDVRRVPGPSDPDLDDRHVDGDVGEPGQRRGGEDLEVARRVGEVTLHPRDRVRSRARSSSPTGSPFQASRSFTRSRCGLVYDPTDRPASWRSAAAIRTTEVFPLVPVTWIAG